MDGVGTPIIERPRSLHNYDTPNAAHRTYTLKCDEPLLSSGRGAVEAAPEETDYCSSVSVSASVTPVVVVGVSASVSSESLFSLSSGSTVLSGALGVAVR